MKLHPRLIDRRKNAISIDSTAYTATTLKDMCNKADIKIRITTNLTVNYYYGFHTDIHYGHSSGIYAGANAIKHLPEKEFNMRLLEIFAFSFFDLGARECICRKGFFIPPIIDDCDL